MSATSTIAAYDPVFDAQRHYRALLQATARPGTIGQLDDAGIDLPSGLNRATAFLALTLLSADSSFYLGEGHERAAEFLRRETLARPAADEQADFLFLCGANSAQVAEVVGRARTGTLSFPEQGATVVVEVEGLSPAPLDQALRLTLTGPGIETEAVVFVSPASQVLFEQLQQHNSEFPLGVDTYLTCDSLSAGPCVLALPRTTRIVWERA